MSRVGRTAGFGIKTMNKHPLIYRLRKTVCSVALALIVIYGLVAALAPGATAAVVLEYFRATAGS